MASPPRDAEGVDDQHMTCQSLDILRCGVLEIQLGQKGSFSQSATQEKAMQESPEQGFRMSRIWRGRGG